MKYLTFLGFVAHYGFLATVSGYERRMHIDASPAPTLTETIVCELYNYSVHCHGPQETDIPDHHSDMGEHGHIGIYSSTTVTSQVECDSVECRNHPSTQATGASANPPATLPTNTGATIVRFTTTYTTQSTFPETPRVTVSSNNTSVIYPTASHTLASHSTPTSTASTSATAPPSEAGAARLVIGVSAALVGALALFVQF